MIVEIPYSFNVKGVLPRKINESNRTCYGTVSVDIPVVNSFETSEALIVEGDGTSEYFLHFDDALWIRNGREEGDPFSLQHMHLLGCNPAKATDARTIPNVHHTSLTETEAQGRNARFIAGLSMIGLAATMTTGISPNRAIHDDGSLLPPFFLRDGVPAAWRIDHSDEFRRLTSSNEEERRDKTVEYAATNLRFVDGRLYHKVPRPEIVVANGVADWCFAKSLGYSISNGFGVNSYHQDRSFSEGYRLGFDSLESLPDIVGDGGKICFSIVQSDPTLLGGPDIRSGVIKDVKQVLADKYGLGSRPTDQIIDWCRLRDLVENSAIPIESQDAGFLDEAAEIIASLDIRSGERHSGAEIWRTRAVEQLDLTQPMRMGG